jgi:hypothetical protein
MQARIWLVVRKYKWPVELLNLSFASRASGKGLANVKSAALVAALSATLAFAAPGLVRAGGGQFDFGMEIENGPAFFGFVREVDGPGIAGADVIARLKSGNSVVTRSGILGLYQIPGIGKTINADDVTISCAKSGYTQANVERRPRADADSKDPIEVECYLQKQ